MSKNESAETKRILKKIYNNNYEVSNSKTITAIKKLKYLLSSTDYTGDEFKYWAANTDATIADIIDSGSTDSRKYNTICKRLRYDINKITNDIGCNTLTRMTDGTMESREAAFLIDKLTEMIEKSENIIADSYVVDILTTNRKYDSIEQRLFEHEFKKVEVYKKSYVNKIKDDISLEFKGYVRYLIDNINTLKGIDLENFCRLFK